MIFYENISIKTENSLKNCKNPSFILVTFPYLFFYKTMFESPAYEKNEDESAANKKPDHCSTWQLLCHLTKQSANEKTALASQ